LRERSARVLGELEEEEGERGVLNSRERGNCLVLSTEKK